MSTYIDPPFVTNPDDLAALVYDAIQAKVPGWQPNDGNFETIFTEALALVASVLAFQASGEPTSIFRWFGPLAGIHPIDAAPASVQTTWTARDNQGYTINAGTVVGIRAAGDDLVAFTVLNSVEIAAGDTATDAGAVTLVAATPGAAGSGLGGGSGPVELIDPLDWVSSIVQTNVTTGGVDAESDVDYLNRLRSELQLQSPRPILPGDFAALARTVAGVYRAVAIDGYNPARNEEQTITVDATGGTYTLTFGGHTTSALAYNASAAAVQTALRALSSIGSGNVNVSGGPGGTAALTVEFVGALAAANQAAITADATSLTGASHSVSIVTVQNGAAAATDQPRSVAIAAMDADGNAIGSPVKAAVAALLEGLREANFLVYPIDPTVTEIDVTFEITVDAGFDPTSTLANAETAVTSFLSAKNWGVPANGDPTAWSDENTIRYLELAHVILRTPGVAFINSLTFGVHDGSLATSDVTLTGPASVPHPNTISGSHS